MLFVYSVIKRYIRLRRNVIGGSRCSCAQRTGGRSGATTVEGAAGGPGRGASVQTDDGESVSAHSQRPSKAGYGSRGIRAQVGGTGEAAVRGARSAGGRVAWPVGGRMPP